MIMLIILHVTATLTSIIASSHAFFNPTKTKLRLSYGLVATTFASGTYLVISTHSKLLSACFAGIVYLGCLSSALFAAHHKLARQEDV